MRMNYVHRPVEMEVRMADKQTNVAPRRPTNVTLPELMVSEAQSLNVNVLRRANRGWPSR